MKPRTARQAAGRTDSTLNVGRPRRSNSGTSEYERKSSPSFLPVKIVTGAGHRFTTTKRRGSVEVRCTCGVLFTAKRPKHLEKQMRRHLDAHANNDASTAGRA